MMRYSVALFLTPTPHTFPFATLFVNLTGSFLLGWLLAFLLNHPYISGRVRLFFGTGVIGAYTTFSAFAVEILDFYRYGDILLGVIYSLISLIGGMLCIWLGFALGKIEG